MKDTLFRNPVSFSDGKRHTNPDPYVMRWCGWYYCYATDGKGVKISKSENLVDWQYLGYGIEEEAYRDYWAPSVFYWNGKFYMYYSNLRRDETDGHKEWLKLAVADNPEGPFTWKKTFFDKFSIDSHPFIWNEKLYMFYSVNDWIGADEKVAGTIILLDEMLSPEEFAGKPVPVLLPTLEQEIFAKNRFGDGRDWYTLEGAATVVHGEQCFLTYSANAYVNVDYFVGTAVAPLKENLLDMKWHKYPSDDEWQPLLRKNEKVEGTGHNTIVKAPNMVDDWIVYHGRMAEEELIPELEQREMRIDPLYFNGDQLVCTGPSYETQERPKLPQTSIRDKCIEKEEWLSQTGRFYRAEYWISAEQNHIGCKYDIYLFWENAGNYVKMRIETGRARVSVIECKDLVEKVLASRTLDRTYDYSVPHLVEIERKGEDYSLELDGAYKIYARSDWFCASSDSYKIGIRPYFTKLCLHSLDITETMNLQGKQLAYMAEKYVFLKPVAANANGLTARDCGIELISKIAASDYTEEIQFEPLKRENCLTVICGQKSYKVNENSDKKYSLYRFCKDGKSRVVINGKLLELPEECENSRYGLCLKNIGILQYQFTKN